MCCAIECDFVDEFVNVCCEFFRRITILGIGCFCRQSIETFSDIFNQSVVVFCELFVLSESMCSFCYVVNSDDVVDCLAL